MERVVCVYATSAKEIQREIESEINPMLRQDYTVKHVEISIQSGVLGDIVLVFVLEQKEAK